MPEELFLAAIWAAQDHDDDRRDAVLSNLTQAGERAVVTAVTSVMERHVSEMWRHGWQPVDINRVVAARLNAHEARLARWVIAAQSRSYAALGREAQPTWMAQLEQIDAHGDWPEGDRHLSGLRETWTEGVRHAVTLMALLTTLPKLPRLIDPPDAWRKGKPTPDAEVPTGMLSKVQALLAKAESTNFAAEAEALTAKAQELMARHRIDRAVVESDGDSPRARPTGRRLTVGDPYAEAKAVLLGEVAEANGCRTVWSKELGFSTVFGFSDELGAVEELFTSLLVQSTVALQREGSKVDRHGRSITTRFRRSFMLAFGYRIGQRLRDTVASTVSAAEAEQLQSVALVPLLAERDAAVEAAIAETFPEITNISPTASDGAGWRAGTLFGDIADLELDQSMR